MLRRPSQAYIRCSQSGYTHAAKPDLKLVVLDLNGTLVWRPDRARSGHPPKLRPGLREFTRFLFANFAVMVWSSSTPNSVSTMCNAIFDDDQSNRLVAAWARDTLGLTQQQYRSKVQTYKNLDWLWENNHLRRIKQFSQRDTIIIDDGLEKVKQHPNNIIVIPEYDEALHRSRKDTALSTITAYLTDLRTCTNVSAYIAENHIQFAAVEEAAAAQVKDGAGGNAATEREARRTRTRADEGVEEPDVLSKGQKRNQRRAALLARNEAASQQ
ncbi:Uncharacterized FCP1 homology domain-containing protein C1271.03c [Taphrina deformans PYCC 5710]|uniref:Mitochondrial import inner membrane translocase subunit TIM50 n=1 Tax=Taphrina deformans (strain PYCC 5710 / ATCC 11124 / CBS 356.35 / IMI 108563 / JCM 9778 / NBRC 8474) TaxID=1097556 RepID=R4XHZ2_TAPDE|nr:Uncharacterized FCP1 homology domain-containing protein C1271.03c [Taphrina deformans PYCC 5710]|eukprot:CCG83022.1 Uncharacterized FCP1 homology domain-containing protein C1271.03c [Taphrina deformans PYCC 5710]